MRDILLSIVLLALLPTSFRKPFIGLLVFSLLAYMRLQDLTWGFARNVRWSFYFGIVTIAGFFAHERGRRFMASDVRTLILIALAVLVGISLVVNHGPMKSDMPRFSEFLKIIVIALFTTGLVDTRDRLRTIIWVIAISFAFFGFKSGLSGILSGGSLVILHGPGGMLADNNDFALALSMGIPIMWHVAQSEKHPLLRRLMLISTPLTMISVGLTHSRGGFLAMCGGLSVLLWRSRNRVAAIVVLGLLATGGIMIAPGHVKDRLSTIRNYQEDPSARARIAAWRTASHMIAGNPVFGVGFDRFQQNYRRYDPSMEDITMLQANVHVAHNSYLQIWAECGTLAFVLYMTLIFSSFLDIWFVRVQARRRYHASWILNYCTMFEASLFAFVVGSTFLNRAHFDLFYHWIALIICFGAIARVELRDEGRYPAISGRRGVLQPVRIPGFSPGARAGRHRPHPLPALDP